MSSARSAEVVCLSLGLAVVAGCHDSRVLPLEAVALDCSARSVLFNDYAAGARGAADVITATHNALHTMRRQGDTIAPVDLTSGDDRAVALVRGGRTLGVAKFRGDGEGRWLLSTVERCDPAHSRPGG